MESILIIDDDVALCLMLRDYFTVHGIELSMVHEGIEGLQEAKSGRHRLVLLETRLPGIDGFEVLRHLRPVSDVPVLLLTSPAQMDDCILGLETGADDYMTKPVHPREVVARIRAVLRRRSNPPPGAFPRQEPREAIDGLDLDASTRSVRYRGKTLPLTRTEYALLEAFLEAPGVVLAREHLADRLYRLPFHPLDRRLDMVVSRLRRKLASENNSGWALRTVRGAGYLLLPPHNPDSEECSRKPVKGIGLNASPAQGGWMEMEFR